MSDLIKDVGTDMTVNMSTTHVYHFEYQLFITTLCNVLIKKGIYVHVII